MVFYEIETICLRFFSWFYTLIYFKTTSNPK